MPKPIPTLAEGLSPGLADGVDDAEDEEVGRAGNPGELVSAASKPMDCELIRSTLVLVTIRVIGRVPVATDTTEAI